MTVQVYTLKTPAERVADRLLGHDMFKCMYKCQCSGHRWNAVRTSKVSHESSCPICGTWRLPAEIWEI